MKQDSTDKDYIHTLYIHIDAKISLCWKIKISKTGKFEVGHLGTDLAPPKPCCVRSPAADQEKVHYFRSFSFNPKDSGSEVECKTAELVGKYRMAGKRKATLKKSPEPAPTKEICSYFFWVENSFQNLSIVLIINKLL